MTEEEINADAATLIVKDYFEKVKGAKIKKSKILESRIRAL